MLECVQCSKIAQKITKNIKKLRKIHSNIRMTQKFLYYFQRDTFYDFLGSKAVSQLLYLILSRPAHLITGKMGAPQYTSPRPPVALAR